MRDIVFAHPHTKYDSYTDYRRLAEINQFEICTVDDINVNRNALYIVCPHNGEVDAALQARPKQGRKCKVALWFLERPAGAFDKFKARTQELIDTQFDYILFSDMAMYGLVAHIDGTRFIPGGSHVALGTPGSTKEHDFCHMSYVWGRRGIIDELQHVLKMGKNGWRDERHETLMRSKFMLNVHQDSDPYHEPLRFALCAAYALPMVSEFCANPFPYVAGVDFIQADYKDLKAKTIEVSHGDYNGYRDYGRRMFDKATGIFSFENNIKAFVSGLKE